MRRTVSTACKSFQALLQNVWASGSTYAEMTSFLGVSRDQIIRLRDHWHLSKRLDRSLRYKPRRQRDPTPREIAQACREIQAGWDDRTREDRCVYKRQPVQLRPIDMTDEAREAMRWIVEDD